MTSTSARNGQDSANKIQPQWRVWLLLIANRVKHGLNSRHGIKVLKIFRARVHRARVVQDNLQFRRITTLPCPGKSPDLFPIEHLWTSPETASKAIGYQRVRWFTPGEMPPDPPGKQANIWRLVRSIRCRCLACLATNGGPIRYWDFGEIYIQKLTKLEVKFKSCDSKLCCWW